MLSAGHSSLTLYIQLYLTGYGLSLDDLKSLRQWGSLTPGHPEHGHTHGVETTTGPLGQGLGNAVGMAMAARRERGLFDPETDGESLFDHHVYTIVSDGDIEEGISHEVSSLAGHQRLGNLIAIYDDNEISIEDDTRIAKSERRRGPLRGVRLARADRRLAQPGTPTRATTTRTSRRCGARSRPPRPRPERPSFIALRTIIGWPAPNKQNTGKIHGSALGADEVAATKKILGFDPAQSFDVADEGARARPRGGRARPAGARRVAEGASTPGPAANPERQALFDRLTSPAPCPTAGPTRCRRGRPTRRASPPGPRPARCSTRSRRCCRSCGAARPTWPRATTPR